MLKQIYHGIKNCIYWLPVIWQDRQWSPYYFHRILAHKLAAMEVWYDSDKPVAIGADKLALSARYCKCLASRLANDDYLTRQLIPWHRKWGEMWLMRWQLEPNNHYLGFDCTNCKTEQDRIQADEEFSRHGKEADRQKARDLDELFRLLRKWTEYWWD